MNYTRDEYGLIQKIITQNQDGKFLTLFGYEQDRYYKITLVDNVPQAYETFLLNDQKQCIRRFYIKSEILADTDQHPSKPGYTPRKSTAPSSRVRNRP